MTTTREASKQKNNFSNKGEEKVELILIKKNGRKIPFLANKERIDTHNQKVAAEVTKKRIIDMKKNINNKCVDNFNSISPYVC